MSRFRRTRLIQQTAGQTQQARFWHPTGGLINEYSRAA